MGNEIIVAGQHEMFLPVMDIELAIERRKQLNRFVSTLLTEGHDFGTIPGAGDKPTLLKAGAEKLATFFGLTPVFIMADHIEDWDGVDHGGEPLFYYRYKCELWRQGNLLATAEGSCNSRESKYRYRKSERTCPQCGQSTIFKSKEEEKGWYCWVKRGGCGATFRKGDVSIESQEVGRKLNPDVADQVNTLQKMAQKRALIAAILIGVNASEFFTQDIEDMVIDGAYTVVDAPERKQATSTNTNGQCTHCHAPAGKPHAKECPNYKAPEQQATQQRTPATNGNGSNGHAPAPSKPTAQPVAPVVATESAAPSQEALEAVKESPVGADVVPTELEMQAAAIVAEHNLKAPPATQAWAVKAGYCENEHAARNSWKKIVDATFGGKMDLVTMPKVIQAYVMHQLEKQAEVA
jgi:hypothetical protein